MQVNEHLECFSQRPVSARRKGLPGNCNKVSQPALIGQSQAGFVRRRQGPSRFAPPVCFPSPDQHESLTCVSARCLLGFAALDATKKVTEGCRVQDYDLLICAPLNSSLTALGMGRALRGMVVNTEQFRPNNVFLNGIRMEQHICSNIQQLGTTVAFEGTSVAFCQTARQQVVGTI